jgi:hypothetical protein
MTKKELDLLHSYRKAIPNKIYTIDTGDVYIGTSTGRVKRYLGDYLTETSEVIEDLTTAPTPVTTSGGGEDLDATLTIGNDGGGQDIFNLAGLQDSTSIRSIDIENRQLISDTGLVWTLDWNQRLTGDAAGQTSIDWENRFLVDNILGTSIDWQNRILYDSIGTNIFDWENFQFPTLAGGGTQMLTVDNAGTILAAPVPGGSGDSLSPLLLMGG